MVQKQAGPFSKLSFRWNSPRLSSESNFEKPQPLAFYQVVGHFLSTASTTRAIKKFQ